MCLTPLPGLPLLLPSPPAFLRESAEIRLGSLLPMRGSRGHPENQALLGLHHSSLLPLQRGQSTPAFIITFKERIQVNTKALTLVAEGIGSP